MDASRAAASRRVRTLAGHIAPHAADGGDAPQQQLARAATAASYASATGEPSSYARARAALRAAQACIAPR
jgi:hypothetical protein